MLVPREIEQVFKTHAAGHLQLIVNKPVAVVEEDILAEGAIYHAVAGYAEKD